MSKASDFVIKDGRLLKYNGPGGDVVIPDGVIEIGDSAFNPYLDRISIKSYDGRKNVKSVVIPEGTQKIGNMAFAHCDCLERIVVPQSVTRIGDNAFTDTCWLNNHPDHVVINSVYVKYNGTESEIAIPEGILSLADESFRNCKKITSVRLSKNVTHIGSRVFWGCDALSDIHIPDAVTEIGRRAFGEIPWIVKNTEDFVMINGILYCYQGVDSNVTVPDVVTSIGADAFSECKTIQSVLLPESVTKIEKFAFYRCENLKQISFSQNMKTIDEGAFYRCEKLDKLPDMSGVESIGEVAFYGCKKLKDKDGYLIVGNTLFGYYGENKTLIIPDHVHNISERALEEQENLTAIFAPAEVFVQAWNCFGAPTKYAVAVSCLENGTLNDIVKLYIKRNKDKIFDEIVKKDSAEMMDRFLSLFKIPDLDTIDKYINAAHGKVNLTAFLLNYKTLHFSVKQVDERHEEKFEKELGLKERTLKDWKEIFKLSIVDGGIRISGYKQEKPIVEIPAEMDGHPVTMIGDGAFKANKTMEDILLPAGIIRIGSNAFKGCSKLQSIHIPENVEELGFSVFEGCVSLSECTLPEKVRSIGGNTFKGCSKLQSIHIPENVEELRFSVFEGCVSLSECTLPEKVRSIGGNAFKGCSSLKYMKLSEKFDWICAGLFDGCNSLEHIEIPNSVTSICDYAFRDCKALKTIALPQELTHVGMGTFTNCKALTEIYLPDNVKEIDFFAFRNCTKLTKIRIPGTAKEIGSNAFNGCKKIIIIAPAGSYAETYAKEHNIPFIAE